MKLLLIDVVIFLMQTVAQILQLNCQLVPVKSEQLVAKLCLLILNLVGKQQVGFVLFVFG
jgi:hypothetical protein